MDKQNKYKEKYKRLLKDYEKLENQCRSLFDRNSHLVQEIRELEDINDELTEQLTSENKIATMVADASIQMANYRHELEDKENDSKRTDE